MNKKILVVEDSKLLAKMINVTLTLNDFEVTLARNGEVATEVIKQDKFDLIILDLMMPIMDGKAFLQWLRDDVCIDTPVLVYTGSQSIGLEQRLLDDGANLVAFKPLRAQKLLELVQQLIN